MSSAKQIVEGRVAQLEELIKLFREESYSVLCASNGISDNEWRTADGAWTPRYPVGDFAGAIKKLNVVYEMAGAYLDPSKAEKQQRWSDACATARYIAELSKQPDNRRGSLERNIADAIVGTLKQTFEDQNAGRQPQTANDRLDALVASGQLVRYKDNPEC